MSTIDEAGAVPRERLAALSLEQKVRLLTGADFWALHAEPGDRPAPARDLRRPGRACAASAGTSASPSANVPVADRAGRHLGRGAGRAPRPAAGRRVPAQGRRRAARPDGQPAPHARTAAATSSASARTRCSPARIGAAYVRGLQAEGVGATVKHFVANDSETERFTLDAPVDERTLRELYLAPFEAIVREAGAVGGDGRLQRRQRHDDDREPAAARRPARTSGASTASSCPTGSPPATTDGGRQRARWTWPCPDRPGRGATRWSTAVRAGRVREAAVDDKVLRLLRLAARVGALDGVARPRRRRAVVGRARSPPSCARPRRPAFVLARNEGALLPLDARGAAPRRRDRPERRRRAHARRRQRDRLPALHRLAARRPARGARRRRGAPRAPACAPHDPRRRRRPAELPDGAGRGAASSTADGDGARAPSSARPARSSGWASYREGLPIADVAAVEVPRAPARRRGRRAP